jgi:Domain of Unknown Function (DUF1080)
LSPLAMVLSFFVMRCRFLVVAAWFAALPALAAERTFDFAQFPVDKTPPGFRSTVAGTGNPGNWKVLFDDSPSGLPTLPGHEPALTKVAVLAQLAQDPTSEHFPMLVYDGDVYDDFTFSTRFKIVRGDNDQMAGVAFRIVDEKNFYVARASALDGTFRFYRVVNGMRDRLIGPPIPIPTNAWQEVTIQCEGNHIHCLLNGKEVIPMITDTTFASGKIGFWTKSDSVCYFTDARITYRPKVILAQMIVDETLKEHGHVVGITVYAKKPASDKPLIVASKGGEGLNQPGGDPEQGAIQNGNSYYAKDKEKKTVAIIAPLHDRNGEAIAAVRVTLKALPNQTEDNAVLRAKPVIKAMEAKITSREDFLQ